MLASCTKEGGGPGEPCRVEVCFETSGTKSFDPADEDAVNDVNLFIFNGISGLLESHVYKDRKSFGKEPLSVDLLTNISYEVAACLNFGYRLPDVKTLDELPQLRYYMVYPDDYSVGVPMAAYVKGFVPGREDGSLLVMQAQRLLAKITLSIDRSALSQDVQLTVAEAELGGCPRSVTPFASSRPEGKNDVFSKGFFKKGVSVDALNKDGGSVSLYMFESLNGDLPTSVTNPSTAAIYPYVQLRINYMSPQVAGSKWLYYRFCIGEKDGNSDIKRNTRYHFTVCPHGSGLDGAPSWRVEFTD